jgi:hypothetical protein
MTSCMMGLLIPFLTVSFAAIFFLHLVFYAPFSRVEDFRMTMVVICVMVGLMIFLGAELFREKYTCFVFACACFPLVGFVARRVFYRFLKLAELKFF